MPAIPLYPPAKTGNALGKPASANPLPTLLQTPSGLAIIEIQGTINNSISDTDQDIDGEHTGPSADLSVGRLVFPFYDPDAEATDKKWMKRVYLYIGKHQRMTGEVKELAKPLAVIKRRDIATSTAGEDQREELEIAEIVKFKILFASRPEPVGTEEVLE